MTVSRTRSVSVGLAAATLAVLAAGCASSSSGGSGGQAVQPAAGGGGSTGTAATLTTQSTSLGKVVADAQGRTVYELVGDPASNSMCDSSCQAIWPPVMSSGSIKLLHGHPLFTFSGDSAAGQTHGQGVKDTWGTWLALNANGKQIAATAPKASTPASTSSSSSGGGGGYGY
jgi:predicted lipoprotein with Yx(FWY)xxD motif